MRGLHALACLVHPRGVCVPYAVNQAQCFPVAVPTGVVRVNPLYVGAVVTVWAAE